MNNENVEPPPTRRPLEPLVRPSSFALNNAMHSSDNEQTLDESAIHDWRDSASGEPKTSPNYLCRYGSGHQVICVRVCAFGSPQWIHDGVVVHGVTHWKEIII